MKYKRQESRLKRGRSKDPQFPNTPAAKSAEVIRDSEEDWGDIMQTDGTWDEENDPEDEESLGVVQVNGAADTLKEEGENWGQAGNFFSILSDEEDSTGPPPWPAPKSGGRRSIGGRHCRRWTLESPVI